MMPIFYKFFQKIKEEGALANSFFEPVSHPDTKGRQRYTHTLGHVGGSVG